MEDVRKAELFADVARAQFSEQYNRGRGIDARAAAVLGMAPALAGVAAVVLKDFTGNQSLRTEHLVVAAILALAMVGVMVFALRAIAPRPWRHDPDLTVFRNGLPRYSYDQALDWVGEFTMSAESANGSILTDKARCALVAIWCLAVMATALLVLAVLMNF